MAKKSKTQRAKASAARAAKKQVATLEAEKQANIAVEEANTEQETKKGLFKKSSTKASEGASIEKKVEKKAKDDAPKKKKHNRLMQFLIDVRLELKRVTWPTRKEVIQWSGVVVAALVFFGVYIALLDNGVMLPVLRWISSFGA